jgi:hypothetical protein
MHPPNHCFRFLEIRAAACATLLMALTAMPTPALAQNEPFAVRCKQWIEKKGYSLDYIEHRTGKRQPGQPPSWKGNVKPAAVQVGDVVISSVQGDAAGQRVAYVEEVAAGSDGLAYAVFVTEWNQGKQYLDRDCLVTNLFGQTGSKLRVPLNTVLRVWRPSLPLP